MPTLAVVGAGPKGIAIAAKARALAAAGLEAPRVVLVDRGAVAGNWSGRQGYTSGLLPLGTPAEKDVGFPYAESWGAASAAVTPRGRHGRVRQRARARRLRHGGGGDRLRRPLVRAAARRRGAAPARAGPRGSRGRAPDRPRPVRRGPEPAAAPAADGRAGPGPGLPEPELSRPAERPYPAPVRHARRAGKQNVREERPCLSRPPRRGRATTASAARWSCRPCWPSASPPGPSSVACPSATCWSSTPKKACAATGSPADRYRPR